MLLRGLVEDLDQDGVLTLRVAGSVVLIETVGEPPLHVVGEEVAMFVRFAEISRPVCSELPVRPVGMMTRDHDHRGPHGRTTRLGGCLPDRPYGRNTRRDLNLTVAAELVPVLSTLSESCC